MNPDLFAAAVAGYWFLSRTNLTRARIERRSGYQFLFQSLLAGFALWLISSTAATVAFAFGLGPVELLEPALQQLLPFLKPVQVFSIGLMIVLAACAPKIINAFSNPEKLARALVEEEGNLLEWTAQEALGRASLLEITLSTGKTYVGFVLGPMGCGGRKLLCCASPGP